jgi:phosphoribosylanthranilate isomerase
VIAPSAVKICGNRDPEICRLAVEAGADLLGFVFVPGVRRQITPELAADCIAEAKRFVSREFDAVGVFADEEPATINRLGRAAGVDLIQLHGREDPEKLDQIDFPIIKVIRPTPDRSRQDLERLIGPFALARNAPVAFLIDGHHPNHLGGEGTRANWSLAAKLARDYPLLLAGGLTPANVGTAINSVRPMGVDVSSGVETEGSKDPEKVQAFIFEARKQFKTVNRHSGEAIVNS